MWPKMEMKPKPQKKDVPPLEGEVSMRKQLNMFSIS